VDNFVEEIARKLGPIDLIVAGSPCQDLSMAKKDRMGLKGSRSGLFFHVPRIIDIVERVNARVKARKGKDAVSSRECVWNAGRGSGGHFER
jgi:site-specific DNA-cytosine methylase